jgi:hypothetical protein
LGVGLPDGIFELLQQQLEEDGETLRLPLGNILEGDLAAIEVVRGLPLSIL